MAKFMYLLRSSPTVQQPPSPEQMEQMMKTYMSWLTNLEQNGQLHHPGEKLEGMGKVIREQGQVVTDGPYVEVKDFVQGYMFIEAQDLEQAVEIARSSPMVAGGGTLEIRPVATM